MNFNFFMPAQVFGARDCFKTSAPILKTLGTRCIIITGENSAVKCGAFADAETALKEAAITYMVFNKVKPNPLLSGAFEAGAMARKFRADFILGIGGGSAMDTAKAAAVFAGNSNFAPKDIYNRNFSKALPIVLVGTTAGTGSEVTKTSVLTIDDENIKKSVNSSYIYARYAFCDPKYSESCPYDLTVSAALDALSHAAEGFFSKQCGDIARNCALNAFNLLWPNLLWLRDHKNVTPTSGSREQLYYGSLWAGLTLNLCGTGFPHPAGYPLSTHHNIPHGKACAVFLPDFIKHNAPAAPNLTTMMLDVMHTTIEGFCKTVTELSNVNTVKLTEAQIEEYTSSLVGRHNLTNALVPSTPDEIRAIYEKLFLKY